MPVDPQIPESTPYAIIGGDAAVRNLVHRFYDLIDEDLDLIADFMRNQPIQCGD